MSELRQDPVTRDWVIVSPGRAARPRDGAAGPCPFCPGNEHLTPPAVDAIAGPGGGWLVRSVPNRYPALAPDAAPLAPEETPGGWRRAPGHGHHEVIVETPEHGASPATLEPRQLRLVLEMYARRYRALAADRERVRQVVVFRNHGRGAGTSLTHPHSQIVATPVVSPEVRWRLAEEIAWFDAEGRCAMCHVVAQELAAARRVVHASAHFVTLAPYASRVPYHLQISPRRHCPAFCGVEAAELDDLAGHLGAVLAALHRALHDPDYNLVIVTPPVDQVHRLANHWFIDVVPRLTTPAGFELGSRIVVNVRAPEQAAAELKQQLSDGGVR